MHHLPINFSMVYTLKPSGNISYMVIYECFMNVFMIMLSIIDQKLFLFIRIESQVPLGCTNIRTWELRRSCEVHEFTRDYVTSLCSSVDFSASVRLNMSRGHFTVHQGPRVIREAKTLRPPWTLGAGAFLFACQRLNGQCHMQK